MATIRTIRAQLGADLEAKKLSIAILSDKLLQRAVRR